METSPLISFKNRLTGFYMRITTAFNGLTYYQYTWLNPMKPTPTQPKRSRSEILSYHRKKGLKRYYGDLLVFYLVLHLPFSFFLKDHNPNKTSFICLELPLLICIAVNSFRANIPIHFNSFQFSIAKMELFTEIVNGFQPLTISAKSSMFAAKHWKLLKWIRTMAQDELTYFSFQHSITFFTIYLFSGQVSSKKYLMRFWKWMR